MRRALRPSLPLVLVLTLVAALAAVVGPAVLGGQGSLAPRAQAVEPASGTFVCDPANGGQWTFVAAGPAGYVIGNCSRDTQIVRSAKSAYVSQEDRYYEGGNIGGSFDGCGWVPSNRSRMVSSAGSGPEGCAHSRPLREFASLVNCAPGCPGDATPLNPVSPCPIYVNYRPWSSTPAPVGQFATIDPVPGGTALRWRYVTRDGRYVMTRIQGAAAESGTPNWGFVPRGCLPATLPAGSGGTYVPS